MDPEPTRAAIEALPGAVLLEFGASWCPHCNAIEPLVANLLQQHPAVRHIKIEDARGRPLGRSFRVKLWPTLVFLRDGQVLRQMSRPNPQSIAAGFGLFA